MSKIVFECLRCGRCCSNLFSNLSYQGLLGLSLAPEEKKRFPKKLVSPQIGIGLGSSGPKHVISYQLNVNTCPHLFKTNLCKVYDKRPLSCQAFPLISGGPFGTTIADPNDCTFIKEIEKEVGSLNSVLPMTPNKLKAPEEWAAIEKINSKLAKFFTEHVIKAKVLWTYDLKSKEWQIPI